MSLHLKIIKINFEALDPNIYKLYYTKVSELQTCLAQVRLAKPDYVVVKKAKKN